MKAALSKTLRKWFDYDPYKFDAFEKKYREELEVKKVKVTKIKMKAKIKRSHCSTGAKDTEHNQAVVQQKILSE